MNLITRFLPYLLCTFVGLALGRWSNQFVPRTHVFSSMSQAGFSKMEDVDLLCKSTDETLALLAKQNFVKSDWLGISSIGALTQAWVHPGNGNYLIVRDHPLENRSCFLDAGTLNDNSTHKEP